MIVRLITIDPPAAKLHRSVAASIRLKGAAPKPEWPSSGEAAFSVLGIGSLGSSGGDTPRPTASLAKIMTAYLTLKRYPLKAGDNGFTVTVTAAQQEAEENDEAQDESVVPVAAGEHLTERQLLEALLIPSGDNIARMLGAYEAGSVSAFVTEMNSEAHGLGMTATTYTDPSGYEPSTVSTASNQLTIFKLAMHFRVFRQIVSMPSVTLPVAGTMSNYDPLIAYGYYGKTGSDSQAEGCLAFYKEVKVAGRRVTEVGVVMGQGKGEDTSVILDAAGTAAQNLVSSVTTAIKVHTVLPAHTAVMVATGASGNHVDVITDHALKAIGWGGVRERVQIRGKATGSSLTGAQRIGSVTLAGPLPAASAKTSRTATRTSSQLSAPGLGWRISHIL